MTLDCSPCEAEAPQAPAVDSPAAPPPPSILSAMVEAAPLAAALGKLKRLGCGRDDNGVPALANVLMRAEPDGSLSLAGYADGRLALATVAAESVAIDSPGALAVPLVALADVMAKASPEWAFTISAPAPSSPSMRPNFGGRNSIGAAKITADKGKGFSFRLQMPAYDAASFPAAGLARDPAFAIQTTAKGLPAAIAEAAERAACGDGQRRIVSIILASDGMTIAGQSPELATVAKFPLPRLLLPGNVQFRPKAGSPIVIHISNEDARALAKAVPPAKGRTPDYAVSLGVVVKDGAPSALTVEWSGSRLVLPVAAADAAPDLSPILEAETVPWFTADAAELAAALKTVGAGAKQMAAISMDDGGVRLTAGIGDDVRTIAVPADVGADASAQPFSMGQALVLALKGERGRVRMEQLAMRPVARLTYEDGRVAYLAGRGEAPEDRFRRIYGAAYRARDGEAMRAAIAAYRAAHRDGYAPGLHGLAAEVRGTKAPRDLGSRLRPSLKPVPTVREWLAEDVARRRANPELARYRIRPLAVLGSRYELHLQRQADLARGFGFHSAGEGVRVFHPVPRDEDGQPTPEAVRIRDLSYAVSGKHKGSSAGIMSETQFARFQALFALGFTAHWNGWKGKRGGYSIIHPEGLPVPKFTRDGKPKGAIAPVAEPPADRGAIPEADAGIAPEVAGDAPGASIGRETGPDDAGDAIREPDAEPVPVEEPETVEPDPQGAVPADLAAMLRQAADDLDAMAARLAEAEAIAMVPNGASAEQWVLNTYECDCGSTWEDEWSCGCDDECPSCGLDVSPSESTPISK